jgi:hypothetical protein
VLGYSLKDILLSRSSSTHVIPICSTW